MPYLNYLGAPMPESVPETGNILGTPAGGEVIQAGAGHISLAGNGGGDTLIGSDGDNHIFITHPRDVVIEGFGQGIDTQIGWTSLILAENVENLIVYQDFNYAVGNRLDNLIIVDGSQWVVGGGGNDVLVGSETQRTTFAMQRGDGHDVIYNWNGNSQLQLTGYGLETGDTIRSAMTQVGDDVVLRLSDVDSITVRDVSPEDFVDRQFLLPLDMSKLGELTFHDEFDTLQLFNPATGEGQWLTNFGGNLKDQWAYSLVTNGEVQAYVGPGFQGRGEEDLGVNPFSIADGVLTITARPVEAEFSYAAWGREYTSGMLNTLGTFEQKHGYFEMRADLPDAAGAWPAFWMVPQPYLPNVEADIMEALAATPHVDHRHAAGGADGSEGMYDQIYKADPEGFHTYGMLWTPTTVTFYYDGVAVLQGATPSNWTHPMAIIANLAVGGWGGAADADAFPTELNIDYIRAYALSDGSSQVVHEQPELPVDTLLDFGAAPTRDAQVMVFRADGEPVSNAQIQLLSGPPEPSALPDGKTLLIWEDAGAVFAAASDDGQLGASTVLMAGTISQFTGDGTWLTNGKAVFSYLQPNDSGGHDLWDMVLDPSKGTFVRQNLGPAAEDAQAVFVATDVGGFAVSWSAPDGRVLARGYDEYAYGGDVPGWYGPTREVTGDLIGVYAQGQVIAENGDGQQIYSLYQASVATAPVVSFASGPVSLAEADDGETRFTYTLVRVGPTDAEGSLVWSVAGTGDNPASADDFVGGALPSGVVNFAMGEASKTLNISVAGDRASEANEQFVVTLSNPVGMTLGGATAGGTIRNDDDVSAPGVAQGQVLTAAGSGSTLTGGAADDTLNASQGSDVLTGGGGADIFRLGSEPWSPIRIADFTVGADKLDLSGLFQAAGYTGTDPFADGRLVALDDGAGGTKLLFDRDGSGPAPEWGNYIVQLDDVSASTVTWAVLNGSSAAGQPPPPPPPPPPTASTGVILTASSPGSTLTGGAGDDTLNASQGSDVLTGGGGDDTFAFATTPWAPARITDFTAGSDQLDLSALLRQAGYAGADPIADSYVKLLDDGAGGTKLLFDADAAGSGQAWASYVIQLDHLAADGLTWTQLTGAAPSGETPAQPPAGGGTFVVFAGQSNMGAPYQDASTVTSRWVSDPNLQIWNDAGQRWEAMNPGVNTGYGGELDGWGPEIEFAIAFRAAHPGETLRILKSVHGGTQLAQDNQPYHADWSPGSSGELFAQTTQLIDRASAAAGGEKPDIVLFGQGEEDANYQQAASAYGDNLAAMFTAIRANWMDDPAGKIGFFQIGTSPVYAAEVRAGEQRVDLADPNAVSFDAAVLQLQPDGLHFSTAGLVEAGKEFFALYQSMTTSTGSNGMVLTAAGPGSTLTGGAADDTLNASQGSDVLTGGAGADIFRLGAEPWSPIRIADFTVGADRLDLSALFQAAGYSGTDPFADGRLVALDDGAGGTKLLFDRDGSGPAPEWGNYIVQLDDVSASSMTWATLGGPGASGPPPPPPTPAGVVLTASSPGSTLTGGAGDDTLNASQGSDVLTGGGGDDTFAFATTPWAPARITDFTVGSDQLDLSALLQQAGYAGADPIADGYVRLLDDDAGGTKLLFDADAAGSGQAWASYIIQLDHLAADGLTWTQLTGAAPSGETPTQPPTGAGGTFRSDRYGDELTGTGAGDILVAGQGPDTLNGGAGADTFVYEAIPWNAGVITDFERGVDVLDLRALFSASGYVGQDPLADRYLEFRDAGSSTEAYFDADGAGQGWPSLITRLEGVSPEDLEPRDWIFH